jgi:CHAT domain-containing protein
VQTKSGEITAALRSANFVHPACRGIQDRSAPHASCFSLKDGDVAIAELIELEPGRPFFAFLSACETAKGDERHADEAIHLAASILFAGYKSVVATMWQVPIHARSARR